MRNQPFRTRPIGGRRFVLHFPEHGARSQTPSEGPPKSGPAAVTALPMDVFEEFRQVGTAAKKVEGTGLGLALSRKFIELHDGKIWVKSQPGEGSTFTFTLSLRRS